MNSVAIDSRELLRFSRMALLAAATCIALWLTSRWSYLLFHSFSEIFGVAVASAVFMISWSSRGYPEARPFVLLGIGYLFVSVLDVLHALSYEGMSVVPATQDHATKLWISARALQALVTLCFALLACMRRNIPYAVAFTAVGALAALAVLSIFVWQIFPLCFVEGQGVTAFKKACEYGICLILGGAIVLVAMSREAVSPQEKGLLIAAFALNIASELVFTLYVSAYGYQNMIGHLLKIGSFSLAYQALFATKVRSRLALIEELKRSTARLRESESDLIKANLSKDKFFSILAHDLRNPISGISSLSEIIVTRYDQLDARRVRELCVYLNEGARQSSDLLECILQWARAQSGKLEVRPSRVPLSELCDGIVALEHPAARGKEVHLESRVRPDAAVWADENMTATVLRNLLSNAIKFTPRGGEVVLCSEPRDGGERISVKDTGMGMTPDELAKLFRIDVHFSCPGTEAERGSGLGLILCKELVTLNKGRIDVHSERGQGSTFILTLPLAP
jgi:signal transduction histidine kinase